MRDLIPNLLRWRERGDQIALATVTKTWGSSPRPAGAKMAVTASGEFAGSVSGGCVETAVIEEAKKVLAAGEPKLLRFGVSDEQAWSVGLTCGGSIEVFVERIPPASPGQTALLGRDFTKEWLQALAKAEPIAVATILRGETRSLGRHMMLGAEGTIHNEFEDANLTGLVRERAASFLTREHTEIVTSGENEVFVESIFPAPKLVIIGAVHVAIPLITLAKTLDYQVVLVDPRGAFATDERFPHVDRLVRQWPDEALQEIGIDASTCLVILTHDAKLDDPALKFALQKQPAYLGVLGSKRTHEKRIKRLKVEGISDEQLARVHAPVGLEIGASTPAEIALSIMAEIVARRRREP
jgi:xanthine dehydrogenase accessory factor